MSNTDKFNPPDGGTGGTGGDTTSNSSAAGFSFKDGTGKILNSVDLNSRNQATYRRKFTGKDVGSKTVKGYFTGNSRYKANSLDKFTSHIPNSDGNNATQEALTTVDKVVPGPGMYASANGQGTVTLSNRPISTEVVTSDLNDVAWARGIGTLPDGIVGQFIAVGADSVVMSSKDGKNWSKIAGIDTGGPLSGIAVVADANVTNDHIAYYATGGIDGFETYYGNFGDDTGDGLSKTIEVQDQDGVIDTPLLSTFVFPNGGSPYSGGGSQGGGGAVDTGTVVEPDFLIQNILIRFNWTATPSTTTFFNTQLTLPGLYDGYCGFDGQYAFSDPSSINTKPGVTWIYYNPGGGYFDGSTPLPVDYWVSIESDYYKTIDVQCYASWMGNAGSGPVYLDIYTYDDVYGNETHIRTTNLSVTATDPIIHSGGSIGLGDHLINIRIDLTNNTITLN